MVKSGKNYVTFRKKVGRVFCLQESTHKKWILREEQSSLQSSEKNVGTSVVVTRGLDGCLFAYSKEAWHALEEKLSSLPFADRKVRDFKPFLS